MAEFRSLKRVLEIDGQRVEEEFETNDRLLQGIKNRKVRFYYNFDNLHGN